MKVVWEPPTVYCNFYSSESEVNLSPIVFCTSGFFLCFALVNMYLLCVLICSISNTKSKQFNHNYNYFWHSVKTALSLMTYISHNYEIFCLQSQSVLTGENWAHKVRFVFTLTYIYWEGCGQRWWLSGWHYINFNLKIVNSKQKIVVS